MLVYKDAFTGEEVGSDSYPSTTIQEVILQLEGRFIVKGGEDFGIEGEDVDNTQEKVINIVDSHHLVETPFDKKQFLAFIKGFMKRVLERLATKQPDRVSVFKSNAEIFVKAMLGDFASYTFYMGESMNPDGGLVLCKWSADGLTPYFQYFIDGLDTEKY